MGLDVVMRNHSQTFYVEIEESTHKEIFSNKLNFKLLSKISDYYRADVLIQDCMIEDFLKELSMAKESISEKSKNNINKIIHIARKEDIISVHIAGD